jgi:dTDP-4-amino-4,6-dideoxygalactose transaminase
VTQDKMALPPDFSAMIRPHIQISPFTYTSLDRELVDMEEMDAERRLQEHLGRRYMLTSSGRHALALVLADCDLGPDDTVTILTSTGNSYVSGCVTRTIGEFCQWSLKIEPSTRLIIAIHEWGLPYPGMDDLLKTGIPVVEDCAYAFASAHNGQLVGRQGKYAIFSLPKFFPINFGGVVCGVRQQVEMLREHRRAILNVVGSELPQLAAISEARTAAWRYLESAFGEIGCAPTLKIEPGTIPGVFMFTPHDEVAAEDVKHAYQLQGIEASVFYPWHAVFIPCHQHLAPGAMNYMVSVYKHVWREVHRQAAEHRLQQ